MRVMEPSEGAMEQVTLFARLTGDVARLSTADKKLIALCYQLHSLHCPDSAIRPLPAHSIECDDTRSTSARAGLPEGFSRDDEDSDDGWLDEKSSTQITAVDTLQTVAVLSTDFAMQNVLLRMGLGVVAVDGMRIREVRSHIQRCRSCFAISPDMQRQFCARCGNRSLHSCVVSIDQDGVQRVHVNWPRLQTHRGLKYSLPAPDGGKHSRQPQLFEDQPMPQNRMARVRHRLAGTDKDTPFAVNDVCSRSAALGIRSFGHRPASNPNAFAKGKKRGGKKR